MKNALSPLRGAERISSVDTMRGFALFGILLVNMLIFQYGLFGEYEYIETAQGLEKISASFINIFGTGSFVTLFSFLFGFGVMILRDRSREKQRRFWTVYLRRLLLLLAFGLLHGTYIWEGDILTSYALCGFCLFLFLWCKPKVWLTIALVIIGLMSAFSFIPAEEGSEDTLEASPSYLAQEKEVYATGSYSEVVHFRNNSMPFEDTSDGEMIAFGIFGVLASLPMFFLGAYVAAKRWLHEPDRYVSLYKKMWWISLLIGFPLKIVPQFLQNESLEGLSASLGAPLVAIFYISSIALLTYSNRWKKLSNALARAGKLSLTNYLSQSIFFTFLFYGYGFGLFSKVGVTSGIVFTLVFFTIQLFLSKLWLQFFIIGPLEWIWRLWTYLKIPSIKRKKKKRPTQISAGL
ncbi:DUF418 domain-containing protein [Priestia filamentosa]|uniref:DUF418 domain-containing protein n=1 Tax=Priestia filamentosa TaxID=1402861 RepID=A0A0H4KGF3_9BACI|nr:DUF418 domain-containing protein [Priestia filamentosa]AKO91394.1 hypothetical protein BEH_04295 [Priestia filamentosa]MDT3765523.1 DUF418 domain-containing protein [Priestia filamentosa]WCM16576.1 DUF418 domain-containing protein [Priestia filamentosa]WRU95999.1 DUF418 domain-containing protein [Priestia filamentosa]SMF54087.1 uncharacterized protein SAMN06296056_104306 [Priestia filamentosa]